MELILPERCLHISSVVLAIVNFQLQQEIKLLTKEFIIQLL